LNQLIVIGRSIAQAHGAAASKVGQAERGEWEANQTCKGAEEAQGHWRIRHYSRT
jgi:hypothetical protein